MKGTIRQVRKYKDLTVGEAAKRVGVTRQTWYNWEQHPENLSFRTGKMIADALGVDFEQIIFLPQD